MHSVKKPTWQQATALVSLSTCGAMTGFTFAHGTVADVTSPTSMPVHLMALDKPAPPTSSSDSALRSAIVSVAKYYLQMAQSKTPAEMEALIWQADSIDGVDHGQSCAAFASLTLALGAQAAGEQSWVTGGGSYPWPLHQWADVRVQPNPASPDVVSMLQDAQAHHRWHPLGDGYQPQPGDWVLFDGHVEVVTRYTGAALYTIGGDSLPNLTVNAHKFPAPLTGQGVLGFVNNGELVSTAGHDGQSAASGSQAAGDAAQVPGVASLGGGRQAPAAAGSAAIPGAQVLADTTGGGPGGQHAPAYGRHDPPPTGMPGTAAQQAFISHGGARSDRGPAKVRHPGLGHHRPGHRRIGLGAKRARRGGPQPVRNQGNRPGRPRHAADAGVRERHLGYPHRPVPGVPQHRGEHRGPRPAAGHEPGIPARHGQPPGARRVRRRPHRRLRHRSELRLQPDHADAAVQPVPLRLSDGDRVPAGRGPGAHGGGPVGGGGGAGRLSFGGLGWRGLGQRGLRRRDLGRSRGHGRSWRGEHSRGGGRSGRRGGEGARGPGAGAVAAGHGASCGMPRVRRGGCQRRDARRRRGSCRRRGSGRGRGSRPGAPG